MDTSDPFDMNMDSSHPARRKSATMNFPLVTTSPKTLISHAMTTSPAPDRTKPSATASAEPSVRSADHIICCISFLPSTHLSRTRIAAPVMATRPRSHPNGRRIKHTTATANTHSEMTAFFMLRSGPSMILPVVSTSSKSNHFTDKS